MEQKWKKGILFDYDEKTNLIWIGIKSNGKTQRSYVLNHTDIQTGEWSPYEILEYIVETARKQKKAMGWKACPRNVASSSQEQINMMYDEINNPNLKYKELIEEIEKLILETTKINKTFVAKNLINLSTKLRKEYKAQDVTRWQLESYICRGMVKKTKSADETAELKKSNNQYQKAELGECPFWKKNEEQCYNCTAKSKDFQFKKRGELRE
jgi:hypothetical protein